MGKIISIVNQKGGVAKTTTAINLSAALGQRGKKVLLVDLDPQGNATSGLGIDRRQVEHCVYDVLINGAPAEAVILKTEYRNLSLLPATIQLAGAEVELVTAISRENKLRRAIRPLSPFYDYIFIDCPPSLGLLTINALSCADSLLIPLQCEYYALEGVTQLLQTIRLVQKLFNPKLRIEGVLLTMFDARTNLSVEVQQEVVKHFKEKTYRTYIPRNIKLSEAPSRGESIYDYAIHSEGAKAYVSLTKEVLKHNQEVNHA